MESYLSLSTFVRYNKDALNLPMEKLSCVSKGIEEVDICPSVLSALLSSFSSTQQQQQQQQQRQGEANKGGNRAKASSEKDELLSSSSSLPVGTWKGVPIEIQLAAQRYIVACKQKQEGNHSPSRNSCGSSRSSESGFNVAIAFSLHTIHLSRNCLSTTLGLVQFRNVVRLSLLGNRIRRVEDCLPLSLLPSLQYLSLEFNPVCHVPNYRAHMLQMMSAEFAALYRRDSDSDNNSCSVRAALSRDRSPSGASNARPLSMMLDCRLKMLDGKPVTREELHDTLLVLQRESSLLPEIHKRLRLVQFLRHVDCTLELHEEMRSKHLLQNAKGAAKRLCGEAPCALLQRCADGALYYMVDASASKHLARQYVQAHHVNKSRTPANAKHVEQKRRSSPASAPSPTMVEMYLSHVSHATSPSSSGIDSHEGSSMRETNLLEDLSDLLLNSEFSWSKNIIMSSEEEEAGEQQKADGASPKTGMRVGTTTSSSSRSGVSGRGCAPRHFAVGAETTPALYVANPCPVWSTDNFRSCVAHLEVQICLHFLRIARARQQGISSSQIDEFMLWWQQRPLLYFFSETAFWAAEQINVTGRRDPYHAARTEPKSRLQPASPPKGTAPSTKPPIAPLTDNLPLRRGNEGASAPPPHTADLAGRKEVVVYVDDAEEENNEEKADDSKSTSSSLSTISSPTKSFATPPLEAAVPLHDASAQESSDRTPSHLSSLIGSNKSALAELSSQQEEGAKEATQQATYVLKIQQEDMENQLVEALQKRLAAARRKRLWQQWRTHLHHVEIARQSVWYSKARLYNQKYAQGKKNTCAADNDTAIFAKPWSRSLAYSLDALPQTERKRFFFEHWQRRARQQQQADDFQLRQRFTRWLHRAEDANVSRQLDMSVNQSILADTFHKWRARASDSSRSISSSTVDASTTASEPEKNEEVPNAKENGVAAPHETQQRSPNTPYAKAAPQQEGRSGGEDLFAALNGLTSRRSTPTVVWGASSRPSAIPCREGWSPVSVKLSSPPPFIVPSATSTPSYTARNSGAIRFSPSPDAGDKRAGDIEGKSCAPTSTPRRSPIPTPPAARPATAGAMPRRSREEVKPASDSVVVWGAYPNEDVEQLVRVASFYKKDHQRLSSAIRQAKSEDPRHMLQPSVLNDLLVTLGKTEMDGSVFTSPDALRQEREWYGQSAGVESQ